MPIIWIPSLMGDLTGGDQKINVEGRTVGQVIDALDRVYPGARARLCLNDQINPGIAVSVDGKTAKLGLRAAVKDDSEILFLPLVAGG